MPLEFQILDVDYVAVGDKPVIRIFGKTEDGKTVCGFYDAFQPYFYIDNEKVLEVLKKEPNVIGVAKSDRKFVGSERQAYKVTTKNPAKTPELREKLFAAGFRAYEADILFRYRFLNDFGLGGLHWIRVEGSDINTTTVKADRKIKITKIKRVEKLADAPLKVLTLDIECFSDKTPMPDPKKDGVILLSMAFSQEYRKEKMIVLGTRSGEGVKAFESESEMMEEFINIVNDYDPDIITGYNVNNFDFPYILERMRQLGIRPLFSRCETKQVVDKKVGIKYKITITGRVVVDSFAIIKKDFSLTRYGLDFVAKKLLGEEKVDVKKSEIGKMFKGPKDGYEKLVHYCKMDSVLALNLLLKLKLINKYAALSKVAGTLLQDSLDSGETTRIENFLLREFNKGGYIFSNKPNDEEVASREARSKTELKGGFVLEPERGLHSDVVVCDFKSMYPSIIRSFNMCPTTVVKNKENVDESQVHKTPSGAMFLKKEVKEGIIPKILEQLMDRRSAAKKQEKATKDELQKSILYAEQWALKILANAFYGYFGYARARMYDLDIANSITAYGRETIHNTKKSMEDLGYTVVYGDSITKDRFITLINNKGLVEIKNIEELFMENRDSKTTTVDGKERIFLNGYKALTVNSKTGAPEWSPIIEIIRHKTNKKVYRVNQKFGETVVTEDHSVMTEENGLLKETKPEDISSNIARVESFPPVNQIQILDLYEMLNGYEYVLEYKGLSKTAKFHCDDRYIWFGWADKKTPIKVKRFIEVESPEFEALCRLCGAYIAEGSASTMETTTRYGASIACSDVDWLASLQKDYSMLFEGAMTCIVESDVGVRELSYGNKAVLYKDKTHKLQMMNALSAIFFKILCGQKSYGKKIPNFIFHVPLEKQKTLLNNMIRGDGFIETSNRYSESYKKHNFRYDTKSLNLISCLSALLIQMGKKHTVRFRKDKGVYRITTSDDYNSRLDTFIEEVQYDGYVYDIAVENNHMFVDSCGQILLHNTDSVMVHIPESDLEKMKIIGLDVSKKITDKLPGIMELQFEKVFKRFLPLSKKRYVAWKFEPVAYGWEEKIEMKGIETVRRDWCPLVSETMKNVIDVLLKENDPKKAVSYFKSIIDNLVKGKIDINKLVITKGITKRPEAYDGVQPHVELVKKMEKRGQITGIGDRIGYVIIKGNDLLSKRTEDPAFVVEHGLEIDPKYYIENQLLPPIERIFGALGFTKSELVGGGKQTGLFDVFKNIAANGKNSLNGKMVEEVNAVLFTGFVCKGCQKGFERPPLSGFCDCGGHLMFKSDVGTGEKLVVS